VAKKSRRSAERRGEEQSFHQDGQHNRERERPRITARTENQRQYIRAIARNDITFGFGSAGSGKTFLAASLAAEALDTGQVDRIVVCRPAVEAAGERLGFLPGGVREKMDPYLRPIFDVFNLYWHPKLIQTMLNYNRIEVSPFAYMRGRTFHRAFVIADEAQNCNENQMLMLLTRLGEGSKIVITGDPTQRDDWSAKGLEMAYAKLGNCPGVAFVRFEDSDVVRHELVERILKSW
jgi:phosphate starvation-inducible PhoH-like protein